MSKSTTTVRHVTQWLVSHFAVVCGICGVQLTPDDNIHWDHIFNEAAGGPHVHTNLRPTHKACNAKKGIQEHRDGCKIDRILGLTCNKPSKRIPSRPFAKSSKPHVWGKRRFA